MAKKVNIITLSDLLDTVFVESASKEVKLKEKFSVAKKSFLDVFNVTCRKVSNRKDPSRQQSEKYLKEIIIGY